MARMIRFLVLGAALAGLAGLAGCGGDGDGDGKRDKSYCETWCGWGYDCAPEPPVGTREMYVLGCLVGCELRVEETCPEINEPACISCFEGAIDTMCVPLSSSCTECNCLLPL